MPWFPVDDAFHSHPKARKAGLEAIGLWAVSGSFSMAYLTDGFVPEWFVKERRRGLILAQRLVNAELWRVGKRNGEQGFWFHQWKQECTKAHVEDAREKARVRKAKSRESQRESRVTDTVTGRVTDGGSHASQTKPNQTKPNHYSLVTSSGELTQVEPPRFCPRHSSSGTVHRCGACADARRTHEAWTAAQEENQLAERRRIREARDACSLCDENGMRPGHLGLKRCDHSTEAANG